MGLRFQQNSCRNSWIRNEIGTAKIQNIFRATETETRIMQFGKLAKHYHQILWYLSNDFVKVLLPSDMATTQIGSPYVFGNSIVFLLITQQMINKTI